MDALSLAQNAQVTKPVVTIAKNTSLGEAIALMSERSVHHIVVVDGDEVVGVLSPRSIVSALQQRGEIDQGMPASAYMIENPPVLTEDEEVSKTLATMRETGLTGLPIVLDGKLAGIVTETDLLYLLEKLVNESGHDFNLEVPFRDVMTHPVVQSFLKLLGDVGI